MTKEEIFDGLVRGELHPTEQYLSELDGMYGYDVPDISGNKTIEECIDDLNKLFGK